MQQLFWRYYSIISSYGDLEEEVSHQANKANRIAGSLKDIIWQNPFLRTKAETRIYKKIIRPILTYTPGIRRET